MWIRCDVCPLLMTRPEVGLVQDGASTPQHPTRSCVACPSDSLCLIRVRCTCCCVRWSLCALHHPVCCRMCGLNTPSWRVFWYSPVLDGVSVSAVLAVRVACVTQRTLWLVQPTSVCRTHSRASRGKVHFDRRENGMYQNRCCGLVSSSAALFTVIYAIT